MGKEELITKTDADALAQWREEFDFKEDLKQVVNARIPRIKIERGARQFVFDDDTLKPNFVSVPVSFFRTRSWWEKGMDEAAGDTTRPDCFSADGVKPSELSTNKQHDTCAGCPMNKFGSAKNNGKACKERGHLLILEPTAAIPFPAELSLPVTSIQTVNDFLLKCAKDARPLPSYQVKFSLEKTKTKSGYDNAELRMETVGDTPAALLTVVKELRAQLPALKARIAGETGAAEEATAEPVPF